MSQQNYLLKLQSQMNRLPFGQAIFSKVFAAKAPYFKTIKPYIETLEPNLCRVRFKKRRAVQNHIGTVHAIAVCNALEMAMGAMAEASIPTHLRWLPKGMNVSYLAKSTTDLVAEASVNPEDWKPGDVNVTVKAMDTDGQVVVEGTIPLWVSEKPKK